MYLENLVKGTVLEWGLLGKVPGVGDDHAEWFRGLSR